MAYTILFRRGTDDQWTQANPLLNLGELGFVTDTKRFKIGDGLTNWNSLPYSVATLENGKIPLDQIPDTSKITVSSVSSVAQRNALEVQSGDIAIVAEEEKTYAYNGSSWVELLTSPDLSGIATEQYVDDSIDNLNLSQYQNLQDVNDIVDSAIGDANLAQYATIVYVDQSIADLDLPDSALFQIDYQDRSIIIGKDIPFIGNGDQDNYLYLGVTGLGENVFTSSSAIIAQYPSASTVFYSTGIGTGSMSASYLNSENTAVGYGTLLGGGFQNVAIGTNALHSVQPNPLDNRFFPSTSTGNTGVGHHALFTITTGTYNTSLGHNSMINAATGHSNIAIGADSLRYNHDGNPFNGEYAIAIGASATVPGDSTVKIGNANHIIITDNSIYRYSDERDMSSVSNISYGLEFVNGLRPVQFISEPRNGGAARDSLGFVASEVASASPSFTGYIDFDLEGNSDIKALAYDQFIPPIVKSIQELDTRLIVTEAELSDVSVLSASVSALTASVAVLLDGEATYETYTVSTSGGAYFFTASAGFANPTVTLVKGRKYRFDLSSVAGTDPFALREGDEVTNYVLGTTGNDPVNGVSGSSDSNFIFYTVPLIPPYTSIIYQSSINSPRGGVINLVDA